MSKILLTSLSLIGLLFSCKENCKIIPGSYEDGILIINELSDGKQEGIIKISQGHPTLLCEVTFELKTSNAECKRQIALFDQLGNEFQAILEIRDKNIFIKSKESVFPCQRIIDLNGGVEFYLDE